jgi:hypothetical protein
MLCQLCGILFEAHVDFEIRRAWERGIGTLEIGAIADGMEDSAQNSNRVTARTDESSLIEVRLHGGSSMSN